MYGIVLCWGTGAIWHCVFVTLSASQIITSAKHLSLSFFPSMSLTLALTSSLTSALEFGRRPSFHIQIQRCEIWTKYDYVCACNVSHTSVYRTLIIPYQAYSFNTLWHLQMCTTIFAILQLNFESNHKSVLFFGWASASRSLSLSVSLSLPLSLAPSPSLSLSRALPPLSLAFILPLYPFPTLILALSMILFSLFTHQTDVYRWYSPFPLFRSNNFLSKTKANKRV